MYPGLSQGQLAIRNRGDPEGSQSRPLRAAQVPPGVVDGPLHDHVTGQQTPCLARVQHQLDLALQQEIVVQRDGAVHGCLVTRGKVDQSSDAAVGDDHARWIGYQVLVGSDVFFIGEVGWCLVGSVAEGDAHPI